MTKTPKPKKPKPRSTTRTIQVIPSGPHSNKPAEIIQITDHHKLSLMARRTLTLLWANAHKTGVIAPMEVYSIPLSDLTPPGHAGYDGLAEAIRSLMTTLVTVPGSNGLGWQTQLLGGNDLVNPKMDGRKPGHLRYRLDPNLARTLETSSIWGKIHLDDLMRLSSKYAVSLYEHVCLWINMDGPRHKTFTLQEFRDLLGIDPAKYGVFGELNKDILKKIKDDINRNAHFRVDITPVKTGRSVTGLRLSWSDQPTLELSVAPVGVSDSRDG